MSRKLTLAAFAILAQGCQQPEQGLGNIPQASASQGQDAMPESAARTSGTRLSYWGVEVPPRQGPVGGAAGRFSGVLSRLDGCLVVTAPNGIQVQPVFPAGKAGWDEASGTLSFQGRSYRSGDSIEFGGGTVSSPSAYARQTGVELAPCAVSTIWSVIA